MHAVLGATGHVGSSVLAHLLAAGEEVLAITHSEEKKAELEKDGAIVAVVDVKNSHKLAAVLKEANSVFVLNPPGDITKDSFADELETIHSIVESLSIARPKKLVVESTQGAQEGQQNGDLGTLFELENEVRKLDIPVSVTRAPFYMSNWDMQLEQARKGKIQSIFPADFKMPMASPKDLGKYNAEKLISGNFEDFEINDFNGPKLYSAQDVADAFAKALNRKVEVEVIPEDKWVEYFASMGFSEQSAISFAEMSRLAFEHDYDNQNEAVMGETTLDDYIKELCQKEQTHG